MIHAILKNLQIQFFGPLLVIIALSLVTISTTTQGENYEGFFTPFVKSQLQWFGIGTFFFLLLSTMDYRKLKNWAPFLYIIAIILLFGLFFAPAIQNVHRWYKVPGIPFLFQPSEIAKLFVVVALSAFLDSRSMSIRSLKTQFQAIFLILLPFLLILKQPDLGTSLILLPMGLVTFYLAGFSKSLLKLMTVGMVLGFALISVIFLEIIPFEKIRPVALHVMKEYQVERLNPNTYHQKASQTAISLGGFFGSGYQKSYFTSRGWLPAAHTDSIFAAFAEEWGLFGASILLLAYFALIYSAFRVSATSNDDFGRLLSAGIAVYLAMHVVVSIGMMCGFLPITGVPLVFMTYGGSSIVSTMIALGILQSINRRRYLF